MWPTRLIIVALALEPVLALGFPRLRDFENFKKAYTAHFSSLPEFRAALTDRRNRFIQEPSHHPRRPLDGRRLAVVCRHGRGRA
jgi:hypothetical protein